MCSRFKKVILATLMLTASFSALADKIGEVTTTFRALSANDTIVVESFTDPLIPEVVCVLSRAKTGGVAGAVGLAEDTSDASIFCTKNAQIKQLHKDILSGKLDGEAVFKKSTNIMFKSLQVVRFYDKKNHIVAYLAYSDKLIEGSPKNSVAAVSLK